ncbi:hypothetical protein AMTRI_Chr02g262660 [Amborella trichopoda]
MNTFVDFTMIIGDLYGDLQKAKQALKMAKIFDENDHWIANNSMAMKLGDILNRGGEEHKLLYFLKKLRQDTEKSIGKLLILQENHENRNIQGDFRYKNLCNGLEKQINIFNGVTKNYPSGYRARITALSPGGLISMCFLTDNRIVLIVGGYVFVHGGILPKNGVLGT